jgi:nitroreductase
MPLLDLTPDALLSTTRAVRRRLDFDRPVADETVRECVAAAMQAPSGSNSMTMQFVVVRESAARRAIGEIYRQCYDIYRGLDGIYIGSIDKGDPELNAQQARSAKSADLLADRMGDAPVLVIPCSVGGRIEGVPAMIASSLFANVMPATWSFMLAARARGLGTCWTSIHLMMEQQVADVLGIPFESVQQVCLTPLAYTVGTDFKPARRPTPDSIIHWDRW